MSSASHLIRQPAVAGTFYPGDPGSLAGAVDGYLRDAAKDRATGLRPKALVAPHAGYLYSGSVAASAYATLRELRETVERVVLLGPSHRVALHGLATTGADEFLTPLGSVPIDRSACEAAAGLPQVTVSDRAHALEHSLEVHLPFLQRVLSDFRLVPFSVGAASAGEVAEVLELLWGGPETLIVVSSDLSHYYDYATAKRMDASTTRAIEHLDGEALGEESACGRVPVRGLLLCARRRGLEVETLDVRSSGDTAGPRDEVVGYGSWAFYESRSRRPREGESWKPAFDQTLLDVARQAIEAGEAAGAPPPVALDSYPEPLCEPRATFVTLRLGGQLRGCIGSLEATLPLVQDVAGSAWRAAYRDPRFAPVTPEEASRLELHVSVLGPSERMTVASEDDLIAQLRPGVDGLTLSEGGARATFLPDVWETLPDARDFIAHLKRKAGWSADYWSPAIVAERYTTRSIG